MLLNELSTSFSLGLAFGIIILIFRLFTYLIKD